jgi:acetyl esterase
MEDREKRAMPSPAFGERGYAARCRVAREAHCDAAERLARDQLTGLPEALVIVDENDVLRHEGEAYARKLSDAGVRVTSVRYNCTIHDFVMLNALADTLATRGAIASRRRPQGALG